MSSRRSSPNKIQTKKQTTPVIGGNSELIQWEWSDLLGGTKKESKPTRPNSPNPKRKKAMQKIRQELSTMIFHLNKKTQLPESFKHLQWKTYCVAAGLNPDQWSVSWAMNLKKKLVHAIKDKSGIRYINRFIQVMTCISQNGGIWNCMRQAYNPITEDELRERVVGTPGEIRITKNGKTFRWVVSPDSADWIPISTKFQSVGGQLDAFMRNSTREGMGHTSSNDLRELYSLFNAAKKGTASIVQFFSNLLSSVLGPLWDLFKGKYQEVFGGLQTSEAQFQNIGLNIHPWCFGGAEFVSRLNDLMKAFIGIIWVTVCFAIAVIGPLILGAAVSLPTLILAVLVPGYTMFNCDK